MSKKQDTINMLRKVVIDGLLLCGLAFCVYITDQLWTPFQRGFFCGDESIMFPYKDDTVSVPMLRLLVIGLPLPTILICEWVILRNEKDDERFFGIKVPIWVRGVYCAMISFAIGFCLLELSNNTAKITIGRPRPHFLNVCKPSIDCSSPEWQNRYVQAHEYNCTGDMTNKFRDIRMSFPSGHSASSAYSMFYLALYLEKRMNWRGTRYLRHVFQFVVIMLSWFTALSRISDYKHHWSDVVVGYFLGTTIAIVIIFWCTDLVQKKKLSLPSNNHDVTTVNQLDSVKQMDRHY